jgi:hypothetical protein
MIRMDAKEAAAMICQAKASNPKMLYRDICASLGFNEQESRHASGLALMAWTSVGGRSGVDQSIDAEAEAMIRTQWASDLTRHIARYGDNGRKRQ